jgi:hypothetical protein
MFISAVADIRRCHKEVFSTRHLVDEVIGSREIAAAEKNDNLLVPACFIELLEETYRAGGLEEIAWF